MTRPSAVLPALVVFVVGCGAGETPPLDEDSDPVDDDTGAPASYPYMDLDVGCAPIFRQSIVPEFHLTVAPADWATMQMELLHPQLSDSGAPLDPPYHPAELVLVEEGVARTIPDVALRLNGNTSWLQTVALDDDPKMQFVLAFNKIDPGGRFQGLRKLKLDMPRGDRTFLQQRVALAWLRGRAGVPAQCANNGRVYINGAYYGLYSNVELQDQGFLKRVYGAADDDGDLWKSGKKIKTNEETYSTSRIDAFWEIEDLDALQALTDLRTSMLAWASEAVIGDCDGYNQGRPNYLVYDRPSTRQFVWLVTDLDTSLDEDFLAPDTTPVFAPDQGRWGRNARHYLIALNDPDGIARYVEAMATQLPKLDPDEVEKWIADWNAQIDAASVEDPHRPFTRAQQARAVDQMMDYPRLRAAYLEAWVACWEHGGEDADHDGFDMCRDCNDASASQSPAAEEVCDDLDNDCDGVVDNGCD